MTLIRHVVKSDRFLSLKSSHSDLAPIILLAAQPWNCYLLFEFSALQTETEIAIQTF